MENKLIKKETKNDTKRIRSENWCEEDKELLKELVKHRMQAIENKNTDTNTNHLKKKAWSDLEKDFNILCSGNKRTITQLKSQWTAIKVNAKKEVSDFKAKSKQTGEGQSPKEVPLSGDDLEKCPQKTLVTRENILKKAQYEIECRQELHLLQIEVEKKRLRNLDVEFEILQAKLEFYKKKSIGIASDTSDI